MRSKNFLSAPIEKFLGEILYFRIIAERSEARKNLIKRIERKGLLERKTV